MVWTVSWGMNSSRVAINDKVKRSTEPVRKFVVCGRCMRMKLDWDMLAEHYEDESSIFIVDVNCETEQQLCESFHPGGTYPSIFVFPRGEGHRPPPKLYSGGLGFEDLKKFVDKELVRPCEIRNPQGTCNAKARAYITKWVGKSPEAKKAELIRLKSMDSEMAYDLSKWVQDRINMLQQMIDEQEKEAVHENEL
jgi:hypothetical protein